MSSAESILQALSEAEDLARFAHERLAVAVTGVERIPSGIGLRRFYRLGMQDKISFISSSAA